MSAPVELQNLVGEIAHNYPSSQIEFDPLPSGVCFLWVTVGERNFVIEYDPKRGTGVSENLPNTPPFIGHDLGFPQLSDGIRRFKAMLAEASRAEPANALVLNDKKT